MKSNSKTMSVILLVGGQGGLVHPEFGVSVNPIPIRGTDNAHWVTACTSRFEKLAASLNVIQIMFQN